MDVYITLFETLKKHQPECGKVKLEDGSRVTDLLSALGISADDVGILIVNRNDAGFDHPLQDKDVVTIIPPMGGG
jgi:molybdopterin converting factor small subunit